MQSTNNQWAKYRSEKFQIGLIIALLLTIYAFNYEQERLIYETFTHEFEDVFIDQLSNITTTQPPPPKSITVTLEPFELYDEIPPIVENVEESNQSILDPSIIDAEPSTSNIERAVKLPLPQENKPDIDEIIPEKALTFAERMPLFQICVDNFKDYNDQFKCTQKELMSAILKNLKYPVLMRENGIEGTVTASFVVNTDGSITDIRIERSAGLGFDEEVFKVMQMIPPLNAGEQNKKKVKVRMFVPVKFKLEK